MKSVLILGAGMVSGPIVSYLLSRSSCLVVVATLFVEHAERLVQGHPRGKALQLDLADTAKLEGLVREADVVVSLAPYTYHVTIAKLAIAHRKHVVTASYVSPEMLDLDEPARRAGVLILNEIGLDPGIDHMSTLQIVDRVRRTGGSIVSFSSCCGGLPAPEANTNPWGYKFSWSPRGVLLAGRNPARYLSNGDAVEVPGADLFKHRWPYEVEELGRFEIYPNRDSMSYIEVYGLEGIRNMFRGTLRYPGWCETLGAIVNLGLLDDTERVWPDGTTYASMVAGLLPEGPGTLVERVAGALGLPPDHDVLARLEWAGLLSERPIPARRISPLDALVERLQATMPYGPGERDMIVLRHEIVAEWEGRPAERIVASLVEFGIPDGATAMARTVSLPAAIATRMLVEGALDLTGVHVPVVPELYVPVLAELEELGIRFREHTQLLPGPSDPSRSGP